MEDNKVLHKNTEVISYIINEAKNHFGEISVVIGNKHTLLGMYIEIKDSNIKVYMVKNMEDCIEMFGEEVSTLVTSPATKKFFKVREDSEKTE